MEHERDTLTENDPPHEPDATQERWDLLTNLQAVLEPLMAVLGLVFLGLLLFDLSGAAQGSDYAPALGRTQTGIWIIFIVEFSARFFIAPSKLSFLRSNWLSAMSLALPFLRPIRALRAARAVRSLRLVRLVGGLNRGMRALRQTFGGYVFAYVVGLTVIVALGGAVGVWYFDRDVEGSSIQSFGDALWWSSSLVTTINNEKFAVSIEARILAILLRMFAISVFGFITARFATYLIGQQVGEAGEAGEAGKTGKASGVGQEIDIAGLRNEIALLRAELTAIRTQPASETFGASTQVGGATPSSDA